MMPIRTYRQIHHQDRAINDMQRSIQEVIDSIADDEMVAAVEYRSKELQTGYENLLEHGLGRPVRGWLVTDNPQDADVWRNGDSTVDQTRYLSLGCDIDCTINVRVW